MTKSIYSLLLSDEIVQKLDESAKENGLSRSAMADYVLSCYLGCVNDDADKRNVWAQTERILSSVSHMKFVNNAQTDMAQIVTDLPFKYNPKVVYRLQLSQREGVIAVVSLNTRTQNERLSALLVDFYKRLAVLEMQFLKNVSAACEGGKYVSVLYGKPSGTEQTAYEIAEYVYTLDEMLKLWICGNEAHAAQIFCNYVRRHGPGAISDSGAINKM